MSAPAPAANAPAPTGFLAGLFGAKKENKPANAAAPAAPAMGGRRRTSRKERSRKNRKERSRKNRKERSRKNRKERSRKNRNRK